jgi:hypothetical protein
MEGHAPSADLDSVHMPKVKFAVVTVIAAIVGFFVGFGFEWEGIMARERPDGCDGPCVILAGQYVPHALPSALLGAGIAGFGTLACLLLRRHWTAGRS